MLDILLDLNNTRHLPSSKRYDLSSFTLPTSNVLPQLSTPDSITGHAQPSTSKSKSLSQLESTVPHTDPSYLDDITPADLPPHLAHLLSDPSDPHGLPGYLTPDHESAFLGDIDEALDSAAFSDTGILPSANDEGSIIPSISLASRRGADKLTERDFARESRVSVHSWLRHNQPQVFDGPPASAKEEKAAAKDGASSKDNDDKKSPASTIVSTPIGARNPSRVSKSKAKQEERFRELDEEIEFDAATEDGSVVGGSGGRGGSTGRSTGKGRSGTGSRGGRGGARKSGGAAGAKATGAAAAAAAAAAGKATGAVGAGGGKGKRKAVDDDAYRPKGGGGKGKAGGKRKRESLEGDAGPASGGSVKKARKSAGLSRDIANATGPANSHGTGTGEDGAADGHTGNATAGDGAAASAATGGNGEA